MNEKREKIDEYIKITELPITNYEELLNVICKFLTELNSSEIDENSANIAFLFCNIISKCPQEEEIYDDMCNLIILAFNNIRQIRNGNINSESNTNILTIKFLSEINQMYDNEYLLTEISDDMQLQYEKLSENLGYMKMIFTIKKNGKEVFPIGKLLAAVICDDKFKFEKLDDKTLNTLMLALQVFSSSEFYEANSKLQKMIDDCGLKCLRYLEKSEVMRIDETTWKINFKKNGVLILADPSQKIVYIRHEDINYFSELTEEEKKNIKEEKNSLNHTIAYYYEYKYSNNCIIKSVEELLTSDNQELIIETLKKIYNEKNYNVFSTKFFLRDDNELSLINPFTSKDKFIVWGSNEKDTANAIVENVTNECMQKYFLEIFVGDGLDCATIGLLINLLTIEDVPVKELVSNLKKNDLMFQNQIIHKWIMKTENLIDSINNIQNTFFEQLKYTKTASLMVNQKYNGLYLYPIQLVLPSIKTKLDLLCKEDENISLEFKKIKVEIDFNEENTFFDNESGYINKSEISFKNDEKKFDSKQMNVIKDSNGKWHISDEIDKLGKLNEKLLKENNSLASCLSVNIYSEVQIQQILGYMLLHKRALLEQGNLKISFKSMAKFRFIQNILYYKLFSEDKRDKFLSLITKHEKLEYDFIRNDKDKLDIFKDGILCVPKERADTDNVITSIVNTYVRCHSERNRDLYYNQIDYVDGEFLLRGNKITKIVFLFDTLQSGTSSIRTLGFYFENFDKTSSNNLPNRSQMYYCNGQAIKLEEIIQKNSAEVEICFMYGTNEGKLRVEEYCRTCSGHDSLKNAKVKFINEIKNKSDNGLVKLCEELYGRSYISEGVYLVIREFNQPKQNAFPREMLKGNNIISLFVKKDEFYK